MLTDIDGQVLAILGRRAARGLVEDLITPVDLIVVPYHAGKTVALAGRAAILVGEALPSAEALGIGAKNDIWTLTRRGAGRLAAGGPRDHDAEAKMFEDLRAKTSKDTIGEFHFKVDRPMCPACTDMTFRFAKERPGIKVIQH